MSGDVLPNYGREREQEDPMEEDEKSNATLSVTDDEKPVKPPKTRQSVLDSQSKITRCRSNFFSKGNMYRLSLSK